MLTCQCQKVTANQFGCEPPLNKVDCFKYLYAIYIQRLGIYFIVERILALERETHVHECLHQVFHIALNNSMGTSDVFTHHK